MDDARNVTQDREKNVNEEVWTTATLEEDSQGRDKDGE